MKNLSLQEAVRLNSEFDHTVPAGLLEFVASHRPDRLCEDPVIWGVKVVLKNVSNLPRGVAEDIGAGFPDREDNLRYVLDWPQAA